MTKGVSLLLFIFSLSLIPSAQAIPLYFGTDEKLYVLDDVPPITFNEGSQLDRSRESRHSKPKAPTYYLGYMISTYWFLGGVALNDDGYVLTTGETSYIPLNKERITELQGLGKLPDTLPKYSIPTVEYLKGFSLWLILLAIAIYYAINKYILAKTAANQCEEEEGQESEYSTAGQTTQSETASGAGNESLLGAENKSKMVE